MSGLSGKQTISRLQIPEGVDVVMLQGIRSPANFRSLGRLVTATLGRLGCAQNDDYVTRVVGRVRNG